MINTIKRGATLAIPATFSPDQWDRLYPWTSIASSILQGNRRTPLAVSVDAANRTVTLTATSTETAMLVVGMVAEIDLRVTRGGIVIPVPSSINIPLKVIEGATQ